MKRPTWLRFFGECRNTLIHSGNPIWRQLKLNVFHDALFLQEATHSSKHYFFKTGVILTISNALTG